MIESISHITFIVRDIEKMGRFLREVFDAQEVYDSKGKNHSVSCEKFFVIGDAWIAVMEGSPSTERSYEHVAFKVAESEFDGYVSRIQRLNVEILPGRERIPGEGRSIYFYDYDNHLFEVHAGNLEDRLLEYSKD